MTHRMSLVGTAFDAICAGRKTVEIRLNDEKRAIINVGDVIEFEEEKTRKKICCTVKRLTRFKDFSELYQAFDKTAIGYGAEESADPRDMFTFYSPDRIKRYGVLAIEIETV